MASLRSVAWCIGVKGSFSIVRDFFGYRTGVYGHADISIDVRDALENDPDLVEVTPEQPGELSLLRQIKLLQGPYINLDIIRVGVGNFMPVDEQDIDVAVDVTRDLFARYGIGVGRVHRWSISTADAGSYTTLNDDCEIFDLIDEWYAPGDGIDVFVVLNMLRRSGATPDKDPEGLAMEVTGSMATGMILAHELGHYLGVDYHSTNRKSLMYKRIGKPPYWLNSTMVEEMKSNDAMHGGCP